MTTKEMVKVNKDQIIHNMESINHVRCILKDINDSLKDE